MSDFKSYKTFESERWPANGEKIDRPLKDFSFNKDLLNGYQYIQLPYGPDSHIQVKDERGFKEWQKEFFRRYGTSGNLIITIPKLSYYSFINTELVGNKKYDASVKNHAEGV